MAQTTTIETITITRPLKVSNYNLLSTNFEQHIYNRLKIWIINKCTKKYCSICAEFLIVRGLHLYEVDSDIIYNNELVIYYDNITMV